MTLLILFAGSDSAVVVIIVGAAEDAAFVRKAKLAANVNNESVLYGFVTKEEAANVDEGFASS